VCFLGLVVDSLQCLGLMTMGIQLYGFPVFTGSTIPTFLHNTMIKHFTYAFSNRILVTLFKKNSSYVYTQMFSDLFTVD